MFTIVCLDDADDVVGQLEQQVISTNMLVTQQQQEITQLQSICQRLQKVRKHTSQAIDCQCQVFQLSRHG